MSEEQKILLVEDDPFFVKLCRELLEKREFFVSVASDGEEALEKFPKEKPDLVILDLLLPKVHGYEVLKAIRQNPDQKLSQVPVIVLTNVFQEEEKERCEKLGIDSYFVKAYTDIEELIVKIGQLKE